MMTFNRRSSGPARATILSTALLALAAAGCGADVPGAPDQPDPVDPQPDDPPPDPPPPDPGEEEPGLHLVVEPESFEIRLGERVVVSAWIEGADDAASMPISWESSDAAVGAIVEVADGEALVLGWAAGAVTITARSGLLVGDVSGAVHGLDLEGCCRPEVDNFCLVPPATSACPMTMPGGYCDPDGDGSYAELTQADWELGYHHYADACGPYLAGLPPAPPPGECPAELPHANNGEESCPGLVGSWRCAYSPTFGTQVSQVCRDYGGGPRYYTFNVDPADCCACAGDFSQACCAPGSPSDGCF